MNRTTDLQQHAWKFAWCVPSSAKAVNVRKLDAWLQAWHPERAPLSVRVIDPAIEWNGYTLDENEASIQLRYRRDISHLCVDGGLYKIHRVYVSVNLDDRPYRVKFFVESREPDGRWRNFIIIRSSRFKKDFLPSVKRLYL